jgi:hypothetical protein
MVIVDQTSVKVNTILHHVSDAERLRILGQSLIDTYGLGIEGFIEMQDMFTDILNKLDELTAGDHVETCKIERSEKIINRLMSANGQNEHISQQLSGVDGSGRSSETTTA